MSLELNVIYFPPPFLTLFQRGALLRNENGKRPMPATSLFSQELLLNGGSAKMMALTSTTPLG